MSLSLRLFSWVHTVHLADPIPELPFHLAVLSVHTDLLADPILEMPFHLTPLMLHDDHFANSI